MSEQDKIRVMIVDDHDMVRNGLSILLETCDDLELISEASSGQEAVEIYQELRPDVVLMDLMMPEVDGVEATRRIKMISDQARIIVLTSFQDKELVRAALQAGAISYLLKNVSIDELSEAIRAAYAGKSTLTPEARQALKAIQESESHEIALTRDELEILALMVDDYSNSEIAEQLGLSEGYVNQQVNNIILALGAASRSEAVQLALHYNLLT